MEEQSCGIRGSWQWQMNQQHARRLCVCVFGRGNTEQLREHVERRNKKKEKNSSVDGQLNCAFIYNQKKTTIIITRARAIEVRRSENARVVQLACCNLRAFTIARVQFLLLTLSCSSFLFRLT